MSVSRSRTSDPFRDWNAEKLRPYHQLIVEHANSGMTYAQIAQAMGFSRRRFVQLVEALVREFGEPKVGGGDAVES